jgi:hypothetical protein
VIQVHERARQGRLRAKFMMDLRAENARKLARAIAGGAREETLMPPGVAATIIQKHARGYLARKHVKAMRDDGDAFVGMVMPPPPPKGKDPLAKAAETVARRHATQEQCVLPSVFLGYFLDLSIASIEIWLLFNCPMMLVSVWCTPLEF